MGIAHSMAKTMRELFYAIRALPLAPRSELLIELLRKELETVSGTRALVDYGGLDQEDVDELHDAVNEEAPPSTHLCFVCGYNANFCAEGPVECPACFGAGKGFGETMHPLHE